MNKYIGGLVVALGFVAASSAGAEEGRRPGIPWATCSAPHDCNGAAYVRKIGPAYVAVSHRHVRRHHVRRVVHKQFAVRKPYVVRKHYAVRTAGYRVPTGTFEYIYDPRAAAVAAWSDIVNAQR
jgi:hypothetical protein